MKTWIFCIALSFLNNIAFATPSIRDAYEDVGTGGFSSTLLFWAFFFVVGWIIQRITKTGTIGENAGFAFVLITMSLVGIAFLYGMGRGLIVIAKDYPLLAILIVAFYAYTWKK